MPGREFRYMKRAMLVSMLFILYYLLPFASALEPVDEWTFPDMRITYDEMFKNVSVEPGENNHFTINGSIIAYYREDDSGNEPFDVRLHVKDRSKMIDREVEYTISPDNPVVHYTIVIIVPYGYRADLDHDLTLRAYLIKDRPGTSEDIMYFGRGPVKLRIKQFGMFTVSRNILEDPIPVGEWRTVTLSILNEGNGMDIFHLEVVEAGEEVETEFEKESTIVPVGETESVELKIRKVSGIRSRGSVTVRTWSSFSGKENETITEIHFRTALLPGKMNMGFWGPVMGSLLLLFFVLVGWYIFFYGSPIRLVPKPKKRSFPGKSLER